MTKNPTCHPSREGKKTEPTGRSNKWYGWRPDTPDPRDANFAMKLTSMKLPASVDLRQNTALNPPIWNQGELGSCVSHGTGFGYEYELRKQGLTDYMPSRLFNYYNARVLEDGVNEDTGCEIRDAMKVLAAQGAPHESLWPYDISRFTQKPPQAAYADGLLHQCITYRTVAVSASAVRYALAKGFPVIFGFAVLDSFESDEVETTGVVPTPDLANESVWGGHCMVHVGYEKLPISRKIYSITRNSWDSDWGDHGYCYMPLNDYCNREIADDFWIIQAVES